ncbi:hypothetical protein JCM8202_002358 [Rhodotorula sphaerocarpa]
MSTAALSIESGASSGSASSRRRVQPARLNFPLLLLDDPCHIYGHRLSECLSVSERSKLSAYSSIAEKFDLEDDSDGHASAEDDSLHPEVRATVSNKDDKTALVLTLRTWIIGLSFCAIVSAFNSFCRLRYPSAVVTPVATVTLSYPVGRLLAQLLPRRSVPLPTRLVRLGMPVSLTLNPGPFSIKEHTIVLIMANVSTAPAYALDYVMVGSKFYNHTYSLGFCILLILSSQLLGFGIAGVFSRVVVQPASMVWPQNLPYCALLDALHRRSKEASPVSSRFRYFAWVAVGAFAWYWLPGYLMTALSAFSWVCWLVPDTSCNAVVNQLFGVRTGLGLGVFTFDWAQIAYVTSPLIVPWWAQANMFAGFVLAFWIIAPALYYSNTFETAFLPVSVTAVFDRFGQPYNATRVLNPSGSALDPTAYAEYSPIYMPIAFIVAYGAQFMLLIGLLVNTLLLHGKEVWERFRRRPPSEDVDVHVELMQEYPEVPDWAYLPLLLVAFGLSAALVSAWPTDLPAWALVIAVALGLLYFVPSGYVSINFLAEMLVGFLVPGKPVANVLFKLYCTNIAGIGLYFAQDLKLAIYMKIPPRTTLKVQVVAITVTACVQAAVQRWFIECVPTLCDPDQHAKLSCPAARTLHESSLIWGLIWPSSFFGRGKLYYPLLFCMIPGAVVPIVCWFVFRRRPASSSRFFDFPVFLTGLGFIPPATGINFSSAALVGFVFQYLVRRRYFGWWTRVTGTLDWAGNTIYTRTADWLGTPYKTPRPGGFGPSTW